MAEPSTRMVDAELLAILGDQNPWHRTHRVEPAMAPERERPLARRLPHLLQSEGQWRHQLVLGPRRTGKTTALYQTVAHLIDEGIEPRRIWWMRMDHPELRRATWGDLVRTAMAAGNASAERPVYVMADEVLYADDWDLWLKTFCDERWPVRVAATSSVGISLETGRHRETGTGRWQIQKLMPCRLSEYLSLLGFERMVAPGETLAETLGSLRPGSELDGLVPALRDFLMLVGGLPELLDEAMSSIVSRPADREEAAAVSDGVFLRSQKFLREDVIAHVVNKDIPRLNDVAGARRLESLLYVLAGLCPGILQPTNIGTNLGIAPKTVDAYVSYLENAFVVFTLPNYSGAESRVQRRGRKLFFVDGAVRNAVLERGLRSLTDSVERGPLLENMAASALHSLVEHEPGRLHYWRDGKHEVDLVFDDVRAPLAFEIAASASHGRAGLIELAKRHPKFAGGCYLVAQDAPIVSPEAASDGVGMLPFDLFLLAVGAHVDRADAERVGIGDLGRRGGEGAA